MSAIKFRKLSNQAATPSFATTGDAGADLRATESGGLAPGAFTAVPTGLALEIPDGVVGLVHPRSGLAIKHGITVLNAPGTIDSGYRGEVKVLLVNLGHETFSWEAGDKVAQIVFQTHLSPEFVEADELALSERGTGGFGSTGIN